MNTRTSRHQLINTRAQWWLVVRLILAFHISDKSQMLPGVCEGFCVCAMWIGFRSTSTWNHASNSWFRASVINMKTSCCISTVWALNGSWSAEAHMPWALNFSASSTSSRKHWAVPFYRPFYNPHRKKKPSLGGLENMLAFEKEMGNTLVALWIGIVLLIHSVYNTETAEDNHSRPICNDPQLRLF